MLNFDEQKMLRNGKNGVAMIPQAEKIVDDICAKGYKNIFYIGIGGTVLYANQMMAIVKQLGAKLPLYVENAADFSIVGNPFFGKDSVVVYETVTGNTPEVVKAVEMAKEAGARIVGYVEASDSPLAKLADDLIVSEGAAYYFWYAITLRFARNGGWFDDYEKFIGEVGKLPELMVEIAKKADGAAQAYAQKYKDEPLTYIVGSGNLEDYAVCYGMCIMEEMQWMPTRPISASNFFHGTLEVVERDVPVILMMGEDVTRPLMERVAAFVPKISANVITFDTKDYELPGIGEEFRGMLSPFVISAAFSRVSTHLEHERRHPLPIRRYYRKLDY